MMGLHWSVREQFIEFLKAIPVLGFLRCFYYTYLYRWHARLVHKIGCHTYQGLGVHGATKESGLAPYFERCTWCGHVKTPTPEKAER